MANNSTSRKSGCNVFSAFFGRRSFWLRRSTSTGSIPNSRGSNSFKARNAPSTRKRRSGSDETVFLGNSEVVPKPHTNNTARPTQQGTGTGTVQCTRVQQHGNNLQVRRAPGDQATQRQLPLSQSDYNSATQPSKRVPPPLGISGELDSMINERSKGSGKFVRASSGNVMVYGNLGNLRKSGTNPNAQPYNSLGNGVKNPNQEGQKPQDPSLCRAISTRMDPEKLKIMGNEDYKNGRFADALGLYEAAIAIDPNQAAYRSNKSAALTALGRILEAIFECREAIRINPYYHRAHDRLAKLYIRLGDTDKAMYHYKQAGPEADPDDITRSNKLQIHLNKCTEAKKLRDWNTVVKETENAILAGADSAPQIYSLQAEAFLKLRKFQDAEKALEKGPQFDVDSCTRFFGPVGNANLLMVRAQVDMAAGRFDDALAAAERAAQFDPANREVNGVTRKARATSAARSKGNDLFKVSRFPEARAAYEEGLDHDPYNSVLLCNRAACHAKLGEYEKAVQDCTCALNVRPSYSKARLRRADCNTKLQKWEASIQDYELLVKETPEDEEVVRALRDAKVQLKKVQGY